MTQPPAPLPRSEFPSATRLPYPAILLLRESLVRRQAARLRALDDVRHSVFVFGPSGQLLHANPAALLAAEASRLEDVLGLRLGEVMGCDHAQCDPEGCGCQAECTNCRAHRAAEVARSGHSALTEVTLRLQQTTGLREQTFRAQAIPLEGAEGCICLSLAETVPTA